MTSRVSLTRISRRFGAEEAPIHVSSDLLPGGTVLVGGKCGGTGTLVKILASVPNIPWANRIIARWEELLARLVATLRPMFACASPCPARHHDLQPKCRCRGAWPRMCQAFPAVA